MGDDYYEGHSFENYDSKVHSNLHLLDSDKHLIHSSFIVRKACLVLFDAPFASSREGANPKGSELISCRFYHQSLQKRINMGD